MSAQKYDAKTGDQMLAALKLALKALKAQAGLAFQAGGELFLYEGNAAAGEAIRSAINKAEGK